jgi:hypothetical protein
LSHDEPNLQVIPAGSWRITNYALQPATDGAVSWVRCSVEGRAGAVVRLTPADPGAEATVWTAEAGSRPEWGPYFCELGPVKAGHYTLGVEDLGLAVNLWLDGRGSAAVVFEPGSFGVPVKPVEMVPHVLLLGKLMTHKGNFLALTRYVARFGAVVTFEPEEAARAEHVILVGAAPLVSEEVEQQLQAAGARVERAQGDIAAVLDGAVAAGSPFLA